MQARTRDPVIRSLMLYGRSSLGESLMHDSFFPFANGRELGVDCLPMDVLQHAPYAIILPGPLGVTTDRVTAIAPLQCLAGTGC